jgi:putative membrane protein
MVKKSFLQVLIFAFIVSFPGLVLAADKNEPKTSAGKLSSADEKFVKEAASGGMLEVELGKIAAEKAVNDKVKAFGRQMQEDHGKANEELKTVAANKGVQIPAALEGKHKRTVDRLSKLSGPEFDRQYMRTMIEDHKEDLKAFQREADKGKDPDVKQFASKYVPMIKNHSEMAQTTGNQLKLASKQAR